MPFFPCAHAAHPSWKHAVKQVIVQLNAQIAMQNLQDTACLGVVYISAKDAQWAGEMVKMLSRAFPHVQHWAGCAGHSVIAGDMDYGQSGGIAAMLLYIPAQHYRVFTGIAPQLTDGFSARCALVHGDAASVAYPSQLPVLMRHLQCTQLLGGLSHLPAQHAHWAWGADVAGQMPASMGGGGVQMGGLTGVAFGAEVECLTVNMLACKPHGRSHIITKTDGEVVLELDGKCALQVLRSSMAGETACAFALEPIDKPSATLVAVAPANSEAHSDCLSPYAKVLRVIGVDTSRQGIVLQGQVQQGHALTLCEYDEHAARSDIRRACAQVWEALTTDVTSASAVSNGMAPVGRSICGAIYIRNHARQKVPLNPQLDTELQLIRHALGPVPLLGFTSSHEVDGEDVQHLSAQLLLFTQPLAKLV